MRGFLLGKFMPPHKGHEYMIRFAKEYMQGAPLSVLLCSLEREPISGDLRYKWMKELFPDIDLYHHKEDIPQTPEEHPDFWEIWKKCILTYSETPTHVFASEAYGEKLAEIFNATFIPVDPNRELNSISGTEVRERPYQNWDLIPEVVKPYYVKRVAFLGPESSGKTTLSRKIAEHFNTVWCHEWARPFYDITGMPIKAEHLPLIARGQLSTMSCMARFANKVLITDTDALTTKVWSEVLFGEVNLEVEKAANEQIIDLSLVMAPDQPWVDDGQRVQPKQSDRENFLNLLIAKLEQSGRKFYILRGSWSEKEAKAIKLVKHELD